MGGRRHVQARGVHAARGAIHRSNYEGRNSHFQMILTSVLQNHEEVTNDMLRKRPGPSCVAFHGPFGIDLRVAEHPDAMGSTRAH